MVTDMNNWLECLMSDKEIKAVYGEDIPDLKGLSFHEVAISRDGPKVSIRFDLGDFPSDPPKKWVANGFNCVQIVLAFSGVTDFEMKGWGLDNVGGIHVFRENDLVILELFGDGLYMRLRSDFSYVEKISAYKN
ncbi:Imm50 family immunity protein [Pseudomonas nitroreducens]|uniref:Imm50 family immunity protein n=1 Tax=Pseudomonas nitroreducens TaxID=46680 RepID=UPI0020A08CC9|nr:Imm50 family immunity protein [Pseudomonas nitroreducens]MCP1621433.1 hypothetical protein [Pseudomonas nitroreducens]